MEQATWEVSINGEQINVPLALIVRYNQPGPRYTSYPTAPEWHEQFTAQDYLQAIAGSNQAVDGQARSLSFYLHLPFCQSLCLYCGCHTIISKDHSVATTYLDALNREIEMLAEVIEPTRQIEQMHWGGGTPTYLSPDQLTLLYQQIARNFRFNDKAEISIEVDPRVTTNEHCQRLRQLGFNRISLGVQDFNDTVQRTIRRIQSFELVAKLIEQCRQLNFSGVNVDLIYGLPNQTLNGFNATLEQVISLAPDRIALFSYAHVPWLKKHQSGLTNLLPTTDEKFRIFSFAIERLCDAGYRYIGLDHFARYQNELCRAQDQRTLHRNFQGYTTGADCDLFGLGVSSIGTLNNIYAQNHVDLAQYYQAISARQWPIKRGIKLTVEDQLRRDLINQILCHGIIIKAEIEQQYQLDFDQHFANALIKLAQPAQDGLVQLLPDQINVTTMGRLFLRNIAMAFDAYLPITAFPRRFSQTV